MPSWHTTQNVNTLAKRKHMMLGAIRIDKNRHICPRLLPKCTPLQRYENWDLSMSSLSSGTRSLAANLARKAEMHFLFSNTAFRAADLVRHVRTSPKISAWHYNIIVCLSRKVRLQCYQFWNKSCKIHSVSLSLFLWHCLSVFCSSYLWSSFFLWNCPWFSTKHLSASAADPLLAPRIPLTWVCVIEASMGVVIGCSMIAWIDPPIAEAAASLLGCCKRNIFS